MFGQIASYCWFKRGERGVLPGWPIADEFILTQQQQGGTVRWERGQQISVPSFGDRPRLGERISGGQSRLWPKDISLIPEEGAVSLGGGIIIEWGLEQGSFPFPGYDSSDAWVGLIGTDQNGDGRLQPGEVTGVIGRCNPNQADNDYYVDEKGFIHWKNYGNNELKFHYIYDSSRDLLKIFDESGNLIYIGKPSGWRDDVVGR